MRLSSAKPAKTYIEGTPQVSEKCISLLRCRKPTRKEMSPRRGACLRLRPAAVGHSVGRAAAPTEEDVRSGKWSYWIQCSKTALCGSHRYCLYSSPPYAVGQEKQGPFILGLRLLFQSCFSDIDTQHQFNPSLAPVLLDLDWSLNQPRSPIHTSLKSALSTHLTPAKSSRPWRIFGCLWWSTHSKEQCIETAQASSIRCI